MLLKQHAAGGESCGAGFFLHPNIGLKMKGVNENGCK